MAMLRMKMLTAVSSTAACSTAKSRCRIGIDHQLADTGPAEDGLDHHRTVDQADGQVAGDGEGGAAALRSAWWVTTRKSLAPLLRASRT